MNRAFVNILAEDVSATAQFYQDLLGMTRAADFGWFVILSHDSMPNLELGILDKAHETIPNEVSGRAQGFVCTFVVDDVEKIYAAAKAMRVEIVQEPTNLLYGQRRLLLRDPAGAVVDVSAPIR